MIRNNGSKKLAQEIDVRLTRGELSWLIDQLVEVGRQYQEDHLMRCEMLESSVNDLKKILEENPYRADDDSPDVPLN